jgi:DNA primase large subunit
MPKVSSRHEGKRKTGSSNALDYCMQRALEDKIPLEGSEGHYLRLAIAVKAQPIGLTAEATAQLFQSQKDYDYDFSVNKVQETWSYNYSPWSCDALRDKCGKLIKGYCSSCPFNHVTGEKVNA